MNKHEPSVYSYPDEVARKWKADLDTALERIKALEAALSLAIDLATHPVVGIAAAKNPSLELRRRDFINAYEAIAASRGMGKK